MIYSGSKLNSGILLLAGAAIAFFLSFFSGNGAQAAIDDCASGYKFDRMSGVGCVQANCNDIKNAHYSYEGHCICGSSGSINENPKDPNKECAYSNENKACPGCVYACVHLDEKCSEPKGTKTDSEQDDDKKKDPDKKDDKKNNDQLGISNALMAQDFDYDKMIVRAGFGDGLKNVIKRGFGYTMELVGRGTERAFGVKINQDKEDKKSGWSGLVIMPDGDYLDVKLFEGTLKLSWSEGVGAEFNLISIKGRPSNDNFVDGFSIGIGPGSASGEEASPSVPGMPISPNINVRNIRNWVDEKVEDTKSWWRENVPWPLGGANAPNIGGGN